jgi:hypothetical protein
MDAQLKAKWVEALRSGDYQQTTGTLRDGDSFCCLGVLCDISGAGRWEPVERASARPHLHQYVIGENYNQQYLPAALKAPNGLSDNIVDPLMDMNDSGNTFKQIADYIEKNL